MDDVIDWDTDIEATVQTVEFLDGPLTGQIMEFPDVPPMDWDVIETHHRGYTVHHLRLVDSVVIGSWGYAYEANGETHWEEDEHVEDLDPCLG